MNEKQRLKLEKYKYDFINMITLTELGDRNLLEKTRNMKGKNYNFI